MPASPEYETLCFEDLMALEVPNDRRNEWVLAVLSKLSVEGRPMGLRDFVLLQTAKVFS